MQGERRVGVFGQERPTVGGVPRLQQDGMALRRTRQGTHPANVELRPAMFDHTNTGGVDVDAVVPIGEHGVGCPAVPELASHGDEFLGPFVAVGVIQESTAAEVSPVNASDEVTMFHPARPSDRWSSVANCRATSKGSLNVVLMVPVSPSDR